MLGVGKLFAWEDWSAGLVYLGVQRRFFAFCDALCWIGERAIMDTVCCWLTGMDAEVGVGVCGVWCYGGPNIWWVAAGFRGLGRN